MNIVLTGSLGHIGKPLTESLVAGGHTVTVISSSEEKRAAIEAIGATAAIGTLQDTDFVTQTFTGADAAFCMVPPDYSAPDAREHYRRIGRVYVQAVKAAGVNRVVHLSSFGADKSEGTGFILGAHDVEGLLDGLEGVGVTHLRPAFFYYNLYQFAGMIKEAGFIGANYGGDDRLLMVHTDDIAAAAAEELTASAPHQRVRYIASDDRPASEVARVLGEAIGKPGMAWRVFSDEQTQKKMEEAGWRPESAASYTELGSALHTGLLREDFDKSGAAVTGKVKIEDFAKEFAARFAAAA